MHEISLNLHMHTTYSDGTGSHAEIAQAAIKAGIDAVIITDHNVWVQGMEGYYGEKEQKALLLVGEEIHNQALIPQKNHMLVFGVNMELAQFANDTQLLLDRVKNEGGLAFLAHIYDPASSTVGEPDISWENWQVHGYTGIELWNAMSEFKSLLTSFPKTLFYAYNPDQVAHGPSKQALTKWDELTANGKQVVAVGGSDAHALRVQAGPLRRTLFPYEFHFKCVNTHLLLKTALSGELEKDKSLIYDALRNGRAFIGYDLPAPTRGFRFTAQGDEQNASMGEVIELLGGITLQIRLPEAAECHLIRDGQHIQTWEGQTTCTYITKQTGVYRVEVYRTFQGKKRGWIFSNPIYIRLPLSTKKNKLTQPH